MTVYELFKDVDIYLLADTLKMLHKHYYKKKKKTVKILKLFYYDIEAIEKIPLTDKEKDFIIVCSAVLDDFGRDFKSPEKVKETKLESYLAVDGVYKSDIYKFRNSLDKTWRELVDNDEYMPTTYGIDFTPRGELLNYEVSKASLDLYGKYICAAEIFFEMTFYGLFESQVAEKRDELSERVEEVHDLIEREKNGEDVSDKLISADDIFGIEENEEDSENSEKSEKLRTWKVEMSEEEVKRLRDIRYKTAELSHRHTMDIYRRILELDCKGFTDADIIEREED